MDEEVIEIPKTDYHVKNPEVIHLNRDMSVATEVVGDVDNIVNQLGNGGLVLSREDTEQADKNYDAPVPAEVLNSDLIETLTPVFDEYKKKYGVNIQYDDLKTFIQFASLASKSENEIKEVINSKLITDACDFVIFKGIMVAAKVIDSQLNAIQNRDFTEKLSLEALSVATSIFEWIEKLDMIKKKYKQYNLEGKINSILRSNKKSDNSDSKSEYTLLRLLRQSLDKK